MTGCMKPGSWIGVGILAALLASCGADEPAPGAVVRGGLSSCVAPADCPPVGACQQVACTTNVCVVSVLPGCDCTGNPSACDDGNPCTADSCQVVGGSDGGVTDGGSDGGGDGGTADDAKFQVAMVGASGDDLAPGRFIGGFGVARGSVSGKGPDAQDVIRFDVTKRAEITLSLSTKGSVIRLNSR